MGFDIGNPYGTIFYAKSAPVRYEDVVLRYTCPKQMGEVFTETEISVMSKVESRCIVITKQGGTYILEPLSEEMYIDGDEQYITITCEKKMEKEYSLYSVVAWLKSSAFIWYMQRVCGDIEIFKPRVFNRIVVPKIDCLRKGGEIEKLVAEIIILENELLAKVQELRDEDCEKNDDVINQLINDHNKNVCEKSKCIDDIIFNAIGVNEQQKQIVIEDLEMLDIYNFLKK